MFRTTHSMFEYKVIDVDDDGISYMNTSLQNCFVEEILIQITKDLTMTLPSDFGFFPKANVRPVIFNVLIASVLSLVRTRISSWLRIIII